MFGWHQRLSGHEFEQTPGDIERQESLACCSLWGHRVRDNLVTEQQQQQIQCLQTPFSSAFLFWYQNLLEPLTVMTPLET